jgi:hypothetical protein
VPCIPKIFRKTNPELQKYLDSRPFHSKNIFLSTYSQIAIEPFRWILCVKKGVYEGEKYGEIP